MVIKGNAPRGGCRAGVRGPGGRAGSAGAAEAPRGAGGCKGLQLSSFKGGMAKYVIAKDGGAWGEASAGCLRVSILTYLVVWVVLVKKGYQDCNTSRQSSVSPESRA